MSGMFLTAPILLPLITAATGLLAPRRAPLQRAIGLGGSFLLLIATLALLAAVVSGGTRAVQIGGWPAPFGITLAADIFSAVMAAAAGVIGAATALYSLTMTSDDDAARGFYPFFQVLMAGVCGAFLTGDLFNMFVWFEVMLIPSFVMMAMGGSPLQMEGAIKYVTLNLLSSAFFLAGLGLLYAIAGTLNIADLSVKLRAAGPSPLVTAVACLFLLSFGLKAAMFPLFFWLPASYHTPAPPISAVFAGLLTKVGVYALVRVFTMVFTGEPERTHALLLLLSCITMVSGVLGAVAQGEFRRLLSFHIISQIGYMILGLALFSVQALAATIFFIVHNILAKTNLFLISGIIERARGTGELKRLGGLYAARPLWAGLFLVSALSLAGLPPLSGFFAKFAVLKAAFAQGYGVVAALTLAVGLLTLMSMTKVFNEAFWKEAPGREEKADEAHWTALLPVAALAAMSIALGLAAGPAFSLAERAATELLDPSAYIAAVRFSR